MNPEYTTYTHKAVDWAMDRLGSPDYATRCLAFVEDAYERANDVEIFGGDHAAESAEQYGARAGLGEPPLGAFVFYDTTGTLGGERRNWGHVGLCVGAGQVVHAWDEVRVDHYLDVERLESAPGWEAPSYAGWAPVERVFEGHTSVKDWSEAGDAAAAAVRAQEQRFGTAP
jgi:cell wall-associated NlpC family hydrolase